MWTRSLTRPVSRTVRRSTGDSAGAPGLFRVDADTSPCGSEDDTPGSRACVCVRALLGRVGRAGLPGAFWCASPFPVAALSFCFARPPPGWGCPFLCPVFFFFFFFFLFFSFFFPSFCAPVVSGFLWFPAPGALGLGAVCCLLVGLLLLRSSCALASFVFPAWPLAVSRSLLPPPPPHPPLCFPSAPFVSRGFRRCCLVPGFFFFSLVVRPLLPWLSLVSGPGCPGPWRCLLFALLASRFSARRALSPLLCSPPGRWRFPGGCCPPPPLSCLVVFVAGPRCLVFLFFFFFSVSFLRPRCLRLSLVSGPGCPGPRRCVLFALLASRFSALRALSPLLCFPPGRWPFPGGCCPPPPPFVSRGFRRRPSVPCFSFLFFFFFSVSFLRPRCLRLSLVSGPGCPGPRRCVLFALLASRFSALRALSPLLCFPPGRWPFPGGCCPPPPPPSVSRGFRRRRSVLCAVCCAVLCVPGCGAAPRCGALCRPVLCCCVLCCFVALVLVPLPVVPRPVVLPVVLGPCALRRCVLRCSPALCALCCVCCVVACWCALLLAAVRCAVCVLGCCVVRSLSSPLCAVLCFAVLVRLRCAVRVVRAVVGSWCCGALLCVAPLRLVFCGAVLGLVARGCLLVVCCGVGVPVWLCGLLPCGWCGLLWCPASLCRVLWCCAVAWCCAVVLCCRFAVLLVLALPSCGLSCCAALRCWLSVLFFARWWCLRAVVLFPSCCAFPVFSALCAAVPCCAGCGGLLPCVVCCGAVLSCGVVLSCSAVVSRCCLCLLCPPVACRAAPCCAVLCRWLSVLFFARWWRLCAVVPFPSLPARTKNINCLTCHPALVAVSWLACLGGCGVLGLTPRTFHLQRKGGESVEGGARAGGEGTW